eukprot:GSChrysophyteH1.ASY1.ANO1.2056.1 assembled CDS
MSAKRPRKITGDNNRVCFAFQRGECQRGAECRFSHEPVSTDIPSSKRKTSLIGVEGSGSMDVVPVTNTALTREFCKRYQRGACKFGNDCRFLHEMAPPDSMAPLPEPGSGSRKKKKNEARLEVSAPVTSTELSHISNAKFSDLSISSPSKLALAESFKYTFMSEVQRQTLPGILAGKDCLAKAKTGTGKTLAFLIPTVECIAQARSTPNATSPSDVVSVVGGTNINTDNKHLAGRTDIVVATPGRLLDHLQQGLSKRLSSLRVLVFDEADQLLDMGFRPDIEKILALLPPPRSRQTLLFSATVPSAVREIARASLRTGYEYIDTVGEEATQTHAHVKQTISICEDSEQISVVAEILASEILFLTTARVTQYYAQLFNLLDRNLFQGCEIFEMHSRKSQSSRTTTSNQFRKSRSAVMFSSDVSARGLDYPDVTFVLQVGLTDREQYIHRLGRTARAGKSGHELRRSAEQAYAAWLGYYNSNLKNCKWDKPTLVQFANAMATHFGLTKQPSLLKKTVGKMGLKGVPGLLLE